MGEGILTFRPEPGFDPGVDAYWAAPAAPGARPGPVRVLPDGCVDLVFRSGPGGGPAGGGLFVAGAAGGPRLVEVEAGAWFVGVRFRPGLSRVAIDADPAALAGRDTPAEGVDPALADLAARLAAAGEAGRALHTLRAEVRRRSAAAAARGMPPRRVREAVARLGRAGDAPGVAGVARALGIAERTLRREVLAWTGLPPKALARVLRFQAALAAVREGPPEGSLARLAPAHGFADQAHMAREFRALAGLPPSALARPPPPAARGRNVQDGPPPRRQARGRAREGPR